MLTQLYRNSSVTNHFKSLFFIFFFLLHVSTQAQSSWNQLGADIDGSPGDGQGASVSISADGLTLATASPSATVSGNPFTGLVRVYEKIGASWIQKGADIPGDAENDNFGASVSISDDGDLLAIGAPFKDLTSSGSPNGRVKVYEWSGSAWIQKGSNLDGVEDLEKFGEGLSLSGDGTRLSVGIPGHDTNGGTAGGETGAVRIYEFTTDWTLLGAEIAGVEDFSSFGSSVSLDQDGNTLAVGALTFNNGGFTSLGQASVYRYTGSAWEAKGTTKSTFTGIENQTLGTSVSLSDDGDRLAIGAPRDLFELSNIGSVQVWDYASEDWTQVGTTITSALDGDSFGQSVQLSSDGTNVVIGAPIYLDPDNTSGRSQVYTFNTTDWEQVGVDLTGEVDLDASGYSVAISANGSIVAVGDFANDGGGADAGTVKVYEFGVADIVAPVVTVDMLTTSEQTPAITGTIDDNAATISVTVAGQTQDATNNQDGTWILADNTLTSLDEGTYDVAVSATDEASNIGTDATVDELVIDLTPPTVTIDTLYTNDQSPTLTGTIDDNAATISVTVDEVAYAATNNGDGTWTLADNTITELAEAEYTVSVTATDEFDNTSDAVEGLLDIDLTAPSSIFINGAVSGLDGFENGVNVQPLIVKVLFYEGVGILSGDYEKVAGLTKADITVEGDTISTAITGPVDDNAYLMSIVLANEEQNQEITITVPEGAAMDLAGNLTGAYTVTFNYDVIGPVVTTFGTTGSTNAATIPIAVTFDELTREVSAEDFTIVNGEIEELTTDTDSLIYTFNVMPTAEGEVTVQLQEASVEDKLGNTNVAASEVLSFIYDLTPPTVEITTEADVANVSPVVATITFSEKVDLIADSLTITGGTVAELSTSDNVVYTLEITPTAPEDTPITGFNINVGIEAGKVQDAAGNINSEGAETTILFDDVVPVASFSTVAATGNFEGLITFSELENSSLSENDIEITNGALSNYAEYPGSNGTTLFALGVTVETGTEEVLISIPSGVVSDAAGNTNTATTFTVAIDNVAPTVVVTSTAENPTNTSPIPVTFTFSEKVTRTSFSLSVSAGFSLGELMTEDSLVYTADITPSVEAGTLSLTVSGQTFKDLAGNDNVSSETFILVYDAKAPVLTIDAPDAVNSTDPFNVSFTFDEAVASFDASNVTVTNATLGAITADGNTYTSQVTPGVEGDITMTVTGVADELGNTAVEASKTIAFDAVAPTLTITGVEEGATIQSPDALTLTFTFSEEVTGFESADIAVTNGSVSNFNNANAPVFTADITPDAEGTITISIAENAAQDAIGNGNLAISFTYTYNRKYSGGSGTAADPYLIANESDLRELTATVDDWGANFRQDADINMSNDPFLPVGRYAVSINDRDEIRSITSFSFRGNYDGNGFIIYDLNCSNAAVNAVAIFGVFVEYGSGLFGSLSGTVSNLGLVNPTFTTDEDGQSYAGLIAATEGTAKIENSFASIHTTVDGFYALGGLVGRAKGQLTILNSYSTGFVDNSSGSGFLDQTVSTVGGLIGFRNGYGEGPGLSEGVIEERFSIVIRNSYSTLSAEASILEGDEFHFPLSGTASSGNQVSIAGSFWDIDLTGKEEHPDLADISEINIDMAQGLSTTEMRNRETYANAGWDFTNTWFHAGPGYHPILKWQVDNAKPFTVSGKVVDKDGEPFSTGTAKALFITAPTKTVDLAEDGSFTLEDIPGLIHSIVIEPDANETEHVKTFYGDANRSTLARHVYNSVSGIQIQMIAKSDPNLLTGNGVVNGRVVSAANGSGGRIIQGRILEGEGLEGVTVFLVRTSDEEILTQVETDENGDFEITGIPAGDYQLLLDVVGIDVNLEGSSFTMDEEGTPLQISAAVSEDGISFAVEEVLGIADELEILVYPNPVKEFLNVKVDGNATIKLMNLSGVVLHVETFTGEVKVDVSKLAEGVHFIEVLNKNGRSIRKLVKSN